MATTWQSTGTSTTTGRSSPSTTPVTLLDRSDAGLGAYAPKPELRLTYPVPPSARLGKRTQFKGSKVHQVILARCSEPGTAGVPVTPDIGRRAAGEEIFAHLVRAAD